MHYSTVLTSFAAFGSAFALYVDRTNCNGKSYSYQSLAGYGFVPSNFTDKFGDTVGGHGSSIAADASTWKLSKTGSYSGIIYTLPDRGWNTNGTLNYQARVHKWQITLTPMPHATVENPSKPNINLTYLDSTLLFGPTGYATTGLDGDFKGHITVSGYPDLPVTHYVGDGFGRTGPGGVAIPTDSEGLVLAHDGSFYVSDEYGPYVYHFDSTGHMIEAIRPPNAFIPLRNGTESWSADSPPLYDPTNDPIPADNPTGRDNNHGFEGLTTNPDGTRLYVLLQAALNQDGGEHSSTEMYTRMLTYDLTTSPVTLLAENVVQLPMYITGGDQKTAATSEFHYISPTQFLILARDSSAGAGQDSTLSIYRHIDVFDISNATNVAGTSSDRFKGTVASIVNGTITVNAGIQPAQYCQWLDFNANSQLMRFGVHNGGAQDDTLLNEKWESIALLPVINSKKPNEYFLFSFSDNDFITQDGHLANGTFAYADTSGFNLNNQMLAFHVRLPEGSQPLVS